MSQEKVNKYKEQKANRKKIIKKEKAKHFFRKCMVGIVGVALIGWLGYSAYGIYDSNRPKQTAEVDYTAITDYQTSLTSGSEK